MAKSNAKTFLNMGYQIAGYSLIGFDFEYRTTNDWVAGHIGIGYRGATIGLKFYPIKNSNLFLNASIKDGGWGLIDVAALEIGGRGMSKNKNIGIIFQIGLNRIFYINPAFNNKIFKTDTNVKYFISGGIGITTRLIK